MAASWIVTIFREATRKWVEHTPPRLTMGQSTAADTQAAALQIDPTDGSAQAKLVSGSTTTVTQATAANLNATVAQATAANLNATVKQAEAQDATAGVFAVTGAELVDPTSLPADGVAGKVRRLISTLKGVLMVYLPHGIAGEDLGVGSPNGRMLTEVRTTVGTTLTADGQLIPAGTGVLHGFTVCNSHASDATTVTLYDNTSAAGTKLATVRVAAGATVFVQPDCTYGLGVYADVDAGTPTVTGWARQG